MASALKRIVRLSGLRRVDPLLFCHIPKCAGTSFRAVIEAEYRPKQRLFVYKPEELNLPTPSAEFIERFHRNRRAVQIIYGHFAFGMHRFLDIPPVYATIVREPIARVVSLYHHFGRDPQSPFYDRIKAGLSLREFAGKASNHMTRTLAGVSLEPGSVAYDAAWLEQAKENIQKYFWAIGTMESMNEVLGVLARHLAWRHHTIPVLNVQPERAAEVDDEARKAIVEHNALDIGLYDWIKSSGVRTVA